MGWTEAQLAYAAGYMDGEGSISINVVHRPYASYPALLISISNTDGTFLHELKAEFGGNLQYREQRYNERAKPIWRWTITHKQAGLFLKAIRPFLRQKAPQADLALELRSLIHPAGLHTQIDLDRKWQIRDEVQLLNRRGKAAA